MKRTALISFGCAKNLVDSEVMLGYLSESGYHLVPSPEEADIIIINTCGFIKPAKEESFEALKKFLSLKKKNKDKKIIVTGCYVERYRGWLEKEFSDVDCWLGVGDFDKIVTAVKGNPFKRSKECFLYDHTSPRLISTPPAWAYVKISEGCSHECSFCAIPLIKGAYRSRSLQSIREEVEQLSSAGVKEINLISQDTTYFGRDRGEQEGLVSLLQELLGVNGIEWIRMLYGYPEEITEPLLEIMQETKICSYLDIPVQHSDTKLLKKMKRGMSGERALRLIRKIKKKIPGIALRTTIIVGFPGEGEREFEDLVKFCTRAEFTHLGVFIYSKEEGTSAFSLGETVDEKEKKRRKEEILGIQAGISYKHNRRMLGKRVDVLVEGTLKGDSNILVGRTQFQAPEVDGVVLIPWEGSVSEVVNRVQSVEIEDIDVYDLHGKLVR